MTPYLQSSKKPKVADLLAAGLEELGEDDVINAYEQHLRNHYGNVMVCGESMDAAAVFRQTNPMTFDKAWERWAKGLYTEVSGGWFRNAEVEKLLHSDHDADAIDWNSHEQTG